MLNKLFSSKARVNILKLLLLNASDSFYQRQISSLTRLPILSVQREMQKLEDIGLVEKDSNGNRIYYTVNKDCPIFEDLKNIFLKIFGVVNIFKEAFTKSHDIAFSFIYGSYAKGEENLLSDIDLMVIGDISSRALSQLLDRPKRELHREINYAVFKLNEFKQKIKQKDHFIQTVAKDKKLFIIGSDNEFKAVTRK